MTFHSQRHIFANRMAAAGAPEGTIEQIMGHSSIGMVRHYARQHDRQLKAAVERLELGGAVI